MARGTAPYNGYATSGTCGQVNALRRSEPSMTTIEYAPWKPTSSAEWWRIGCFTLPAGWVLAITLGLQICIPGGLAQSAVVTDLPQEPLRADPSSPPAPFISNPPSTGTLTTPPPIRSSVLPPLRIPASENASLDAEVARLRATALGQAGIRSLAAGTPNRSQAQASWVLGLLYAHGIGVALNLPEAAGWFKRAHALGEPLAAAGMAWCAIEGCNSPPDPAAARPWLAPLGAVNLPRAQYFQWLIETRLAPLQIATPTQRSDPGTLQPDRLRARQLLVSSAQRGDVQANMTLGFDSITQDRSAQALAFFRAVAPRSAAAQANVALLSSSAPVKGTTAVLGAAASGSAEDNLSKAQRNHRGEGQPSNFVEAIRLYRLAQSQGSTAARKMLELIFSRPAPNGDIDVTWMQQLAFVDVTQRVPGLPSVPNTPNRRSFQREPTALFDLLPSLWRTHARSAMAPVEPVEVK